MMAIPSVAGVIFSRASTVFSTDFASNRTRLLRWGYALLMFSQHPILGAGYGSFALKYVNETFLGDNRYYQMGAHNEHLQILAEMGIIGGIVWLWLNVAFFRYGFRLMRRLRHDFFWYSITAGLLAAQVASLTQLIVFNYFSTDRFAVLFWFVYGAVPAIGVITQDSVDDSNETTVRES